MNSAWLFLLAIEDRTEFSNAFRNFFAFITKYIYIFFSGAIDLMYDLATFDFGVDNLVTEIGNRIFSFLIIFMLFKVSFSLLTYMVNPEIATDKSKGAQGLIKRILISIILLVSINPIFTVLKTLQSAIIEDDIITKVFLVNDNSKVMTIGNTEVVGIKMSQHCPLDKYVYTASRGDRTALLLFRPFLQPHPEEDINKSDKDAWDGVFNGDKNDDFSYYCGVDDDVLSNIKVVSGTNVKMTAEKIKEKIDGPNSAEGFLLRYYYNLGTNEAGGAAGEPGKGAKGDYFFDFNFIFAIIAGFLGLLIIISFCFDVIIRTLNLIFLQIVAPVPIISYIDPNGKSSDALGNWGKKLFAVWSSLFIRIIILNFAITLITVACDTIVNNADFSNVSLLMGLFIVLGTLMFAKKLPSLIEELFPGLKIGDGFKFSPIKRIESDAAGGKFITDTAKGIIERTSGALTGGFGGAIAGNKAGKETGSPLSGTLLGMTSGVAHGIKKKKIAFGSAMNETYKNLTGNEMRIMTPTSIVLPMLGDKKVKETKAYIGKGKQKLTELNTSLNISEGMSSNLALELSSRGYNYNDISGMSAMVNERINNQQGKINQLHSRTSEIENNMNEKKTTYDNAYKAYERDERTHDEFVRKYDEFKSNYDSKLEEINKLQNEIMLSKQNLSSGTMIGSFKLEAEENIKKLELQKANLKTELDGIKGVLSETQKNIDAAKHNLENSKQAIEITKNEMNKAQQAMYDHSMEIQKAQKEYDECVLDGKKIEQYVNHRNNEEKLRQQIDQLNKYIDTIKSEKAQSERYYRIDPSPKKDYDSAKEEIDKL